MQVPAEAPRSIALRGAQRWAEALAWACLAAYTLLGLDHPVGDGDESVHALVLTRMLQSGDFLHAYWQGALALQRPQLPYWLAAAFAAWVPGEIGLRLSSALCSLGTLVIVQRTALACWQRHDAAWLATLLLAGAASFHVYSRTLMSDPPFVLALCIALAGALDVDRPQRGLYRMALGLGLATACKSLAVAVPALALSPAIVRATRAAGGPRALPGPLALLGALALPYYVLGFALHGRLFWEEHVLFNLVQRATSGYGLGLQGDGLVYARWIAVADGPLGVAWLALGSAGALGAGLWWRDARLALAGGFASAVFVLMSVLGTRLPHYVLPAYPAAALGVAGLWVHAGAAPGRRGAWLRTLAVPLGLILLLEARGHPGGRPYLLQRPHGKQLGRIAKRRMPAERPLYAYGWYGPSLALYAERKVILATNSPAFFAGVNFDVIARADAARLVPPAPEPVGRELWVAAKPSLLAATAWLSVVEVLGRSEAVASELPAQGGPNAASTTPWRSIVDATRHPEPYVLVRARVISER